MPEVITKICNKCGSQYELTGYPIPVRDKDNLLCDICGTELMRWNGGVMWASKLIKEGIKAKGDKSK